MQHFPLFRDHIARESDVYRMIRRVFDEESPNTNKAFVDIGSNHGIMSLFAAKNGASTIIAVEPNYFLSTLILRSFQQNAISNAELFNAACIDAATNETVTLKDHNIAEGAIGTVVRSGSKTNKRKSSGTIQIPAVPVAGFLPTQGGVVGVLKIDVEGHELSVMQSLIPALKTKAWSIENVIVEFGPPSRWRKSSSTYTTALAVDILASLREQGYQIHVMDSFAYGLYKSKIGYGPERNPKEMKTNRYGTRVDPLENGDWTVMDAMSECDCESYLWLYLPKNGTDAANQYKYNRNHWSMYSSINAMYRQTWFWMFSSYGWLWLLMLSCCVICFVLFKVHVEKVDGDNTRSDSYRQRKIGGSYLKRSRRKKKAVLGSFGV